MIQNKLEFQTKFEFLLFVLKGCYHHYETLKNYFLTKLLENSLKKRYLMGYLKIQINLNMNGLLTKKLEGMNNTNNIITTKNKKN